MLYLDMYNAAVASGVRWERKQTLLIWKFEG